MRPYAGLWVDYNSLYLIVNSIVIFPRPLQRVNGVVEWGRSVLLVEHLCICLLFSKTNNRSTEKGEERGGSWPNDLNIHFMEHGHWASPMYFVFCRLYPSPSPYHRGSVWLLLVYFILLTNTVSRVRLAYPYDWRGFVGTKKKTSVGLLVILFLDDSKCIELST
jgi:hypothetical protein